MSPSSNLPSQSSRRAFLKSSVTAAAVLASSQSLVAAAGSEPEVIPIGSRRELFVDGHLIDKLIGDAEQRLHHPVPREIALVHDTPWEGTGSGYHSVFQDGDIYRMYYKAWHLEVSQGKMDMDRHPLFCCYAESDDGITWRKPMLDLYEFEGSKQNNICMVSGPLGALDVDAGHPAVFKDENPNAPADARYKAIFRSIKPGGLLPFKSADGLRWTPMTDAPVLQGVGVFDSQNLAFWDPNIGKYRAYWRYFNKEIVNEIANKDPTQPAGIRAIRTATSDDLIHWDPHTDLTYVDSPPQQLYTNQIKPYHRAPHMLIGFPTRYFDRGWSESMKSLPALEQRQLRASSTPRYGTAITDALFMSSRNGTLFNRWNEAFLRPGIERPDVWHYGSQYIGWHLVETKSSLPGAPNELSLYAVESFWHGKGSALRRYSMRLDGFVSIVAPMGKGNELITKPLTFTGSNLHLNFASSAAGSIRVEFQNPDGSPVNGFSLDDCDELFGDTVDRVVRWKNNSDVSKLIDKPIRIRFELRDVDLYSFKFSRGV